MEEGGGCVVVFGRVAIVFACIFSMKGKKS